MLILFLIVYTYFGQIQASFKYLNTQNHVFDSIQIKQRGHMAPENAFYYRNCLYKQANIRLTSKFKEGGGTTIFEIIDEVIGRQVKQIDCHLTGNHFDFSLNTQASQLFEAGDAFILHFGLHHHGHDALHAGNGGADDREPLIHGHGHRHTGIPQRADADLDVFLQ